MKRLLALLTVVTALMIGGSLAPASNAHSLPSSAAVVHHKNCGSRTHAVINGEEKCLSAGEYCTHLADRQYKKYGFRCTKRDSRGSYHLTYA